jgi:Putative peptidoglycan binding domain
MVLDRDDRGGRRTRGPDRGRGIARAARTLALTAVLTLAAAFAAAAFAAAGTALASGGAPLGGPPPTKHHHARHHSKGHHSHRHHRSKPSAHHAAGPNPLKGRAMWIWELGSTDHGDLSAIIAGAKLYGVNTVFIKSSDGRDFWSNQFTRTIVHALRAGGLKVCAWQYVYGSSPLKEANLGAEAVRDGANCLVIDAEAQYEGRYIAAQTYIERLRSLIGPSYPVALAGFPYVDFHPSFPYSVFLGPGGAQYNVPQMYWKDIGTSVAAVYAHTYSFNRIYQRPIFPLGQLYSNPPPGQIVRFRELDLAYGAGGISWWDWQSASAKAWNAMSLPIDTLPDVTPDKAMAVVGRGASGDLVVWAQEHLVSAGFPVKISGEFKYRTYNAVLAFQAKHGLTTDGELGPDTWAALLRYKPVHVDWSLDRRLAAGAQLRTAAASLGAGGSPTVTLPVPLSASDPARRNEIPGSLGAGR